MSRVERFRMQSLTGLLLPSIETRALAVANLANTVGTGIFMTGSAIFFVRWAGLSVPELSLSLTVAGSVGLALSLPLGLLADRLGPREIAISMLWLRALATAAFTLVHSPLTLILAGCVAFSADRGGQAAFGALIALVGGEERVTLRAHLRALTNIGVSIGTGVAGFVIANGSRMAYNGMILLNAAALFAAGAALLRVSRRPPIPPPPGAERLPSLRDVPYLMATGLHGVLNLSYEVLSFALPLWVVTRTAAPSWIISLLVLLNTVLVVFFQVPASRGLKTARQAAIAGQRSGLTFLLSCVLIAPTGHLSPVLAAALLFFAVGVLTLGELWHAAASFTLSFELAQQHALGQYQAVYAMGDGLERALAPIILGALCLTWGPLGWLVLGTMFVLGGAPLPAVVQASERRAAALAGGCTANPPKPSRVAVPSRLPDESSSQNRLA
jgi:MFS family permease